MSCACTRAVRWQILRRGDGRIERATAGPGHRYRRLGERFAAWLWRHGCAGLPGRETVSRRETIGRHTAHLNRLDEVTIHDRFHPLRSQCLPVVRRCELYGDAYYILRRPDGRPLAVLGMTRPEMAKTTIVSTARLPTVVLIALRREVVTSLSCCEQIVQEENRDVSMKDQTSAAAVRRSSSTNSSRRFPASGAGATLPGAEALDSGPGGHDAQIGRR
jgi:hypothetical protein